MNKLYILSDGTYTKIGITRNIKNRLSTYKTHNPTSSLHYIYHFNHEDDARMIESHMKSSNKNELVGTSTEWFYLSVEQLKDKLDEAVTTRKITSFIECIPQDDGFVKYSSSALDRLINLKNSAAQRALFIFSINMDRENKVCLTQQTLAALLGVSRQTVSSALNELISSQLITIIEEGNQRIYKLNEKLFLHD